jgi:hypothetical protein
MKHPSIFFIFLMLASAFIPCMPVRAEPSLVPHEDPSAVQSVMDSYSFLAQYSEIFALMSSQQYDNASRLSEQLSHITVPEDLRYVINRYNDLTQQLIGVLNALQSTLDRASSLLDQYRLDEAGQALDQAGVLVAKAQILLGDLKDATLTLSQRLGVFAVSADDKIRQAYNQLQNMLQRLLDLINQYHTLLQRANQRVEEIKSQNLDHTELSLTLNTTKCFVGGYLSASGVLTSKGQILENRAVQLLLDGSEVTTANTDSNGSYHALIRIPYKYVDSVSVSTLYTPLGGDRGVYLASLSPAIKVQVQFYNTMLNVSVPSVAYPGLSLTIKGDVFSQAGIPLNGRQVKVLLDGAMITQVKTDHTGAFMTKPTIYSHAKLGTHSLTVTVDPEGLYAGVTVKKTFTLQKMPSFVEVNAPSFVTLPSQLQINGAVKSASGPLNGANVQVEFANMSATVKTLSDGSFNLTMDVPLNTVFAGYQDFRVLAQPSEPWQAVAQKNVSVFVLNSVGMGLALASSLSVGFIMYFRFAKTRSKKAEKSIGTPTVFTLPEEEAPVMVVPAIPETKFEGLKGKVLKAYVEALRAVQSATGESLMLNMTLREYLQASSSKMREALEPFSELTAVAERSLYSPHIPKEEDTEKAENLASTIRRILSGGIA